MDGEKRTLSEGTALPGGYELRELIGAGGMGQVWKGFDHRLERFVAIKLLRTNNASLGARLVREARALAKIRHAGLVTVFDIRRLDDGSPFVVMELLEGRTLHELRKDTRVIGARRAVELMLPVLDGLAVAHDAGIVHRDLKLGNVILADRGPVLIDFGIAHFEAMRSELTVGLLGTPDFMAPEQSILGERIGPAVDQWAACVCIYLLAAGVYPFRGNDSWALFKAIRKAPLPFPRDGSIDGRLFRVLARGTRKTAGERFASVRELSLALREWLGHRPRQEQPSGVRLRGDREAPTVESATLDPIIRAKLGGK